MVLHLALLLLSVLFLPIQGCTKIPRFKMAKGLSISTIDSKFLRLPTKALENRTELRDDFIFPSRFDLSREYPNCPIRRVFYQGPCGTCWAIASATAMSDAVCIKSGKFVEYSAADLLTCCTNCGGYEGGYPYYAFQYFSQKGCVTGGYSATPDGSCFPYIDNYNYTLTCPAYPICHRGSCPANTFRKNVDLDTGERGLMRLLYTRRIPIVVGIYTNDDLMKYTGGVFKQLPRPNKAEPNHAVKVIGWGMDFVTGEKYWIIVNSWGTSWGMNGTFWLRKGQDDMSIEYGMGGVTAYIPY